MGNKDAAIARPWGWELPSTSLFSRIPSRPRHRQPQGFDTIFDFRTIIYDAFYLPERKELLIIGPPLLNLHAMASGISASSGVETLPVLVQELDRHMRMTVQLQGRPDHVVLQSRIGDMRVPVIEADQKTFAGKRVLLTLSKNNRLEWICDWIRFHRDHHGANAVLLYDNNSTLYTLDELASAIASLSGIDAFKVIHWPYKYGPQGDGYSYWDSDFCQSGALEDARWRYLQRARSVLNVDIDELVLPRLQSVFERVEAEPSGYIAFRGQWVVNASCNDNGEPLEGTPLLHRNCLLRLRPRWGCFSWRGWRVVPGRVNTCPRKWAAVPDRHPNHAQWQVHRVRGIAGSKRVDTCVEYRHLRPISTSWNYSRRAAESFSATVHIVDHELMDGYEKVAWGKHTEVN
jgi:Glycosyltransferase family 92